MLWSTVKLLLAIVMSIIFGPLKNSSEVIEKLRLRNFQGSQVSSFDFSTLYTSLSHDLIKAKVLSLVNWCFNRESKSYLCTSLKAGFFSNKKYDSYWCWSCAELCEAFTFLMENIYVQFDGMLYQQIAEIPLGTNCSRFIADLISYCYERDFMSDLQKSKRHDLIDMFIRASGKPPRWLLDPPLWVLKVPNNDNKYNTPFLLKFFFYFHFEILK